jgi:hypothetical protein
MRFLPIRIPLAILAIAFLSAIALADQTVKLIVQFSPDWHVAAAEVQSSEKSPPVSGKVSRDGATFADLNPGSRYDVRLTLADGRVLQGVGMDWYNADPPDPDAEALDDDDRQQITQILNTPSFFNQNDLLFLRGNHDRAVALVQLVRDQPFAGETTSQVVWRVELWYMKNEHGGWVKESDRVVRRERFDDPGKFHQATDKLIWVVELGGITVPADRFLTVIAPEIPATQATTEK